MSDPKVLHWVDDSGRPAVNVEYDGIDVTIFKSDADNKIGVLVDSNNVDQDAVRVYMDGSVIHGTALYDIHDIEKNFSVVFSDAKSTTGKK